MLFWKPVQPDRISARLETQMGLGETALLNVVPVRTRRSRFGVWIRRLPRAAMVSGR